MKILNFIRHHLIRVGDRHTAVHNVMVSGDRHEVSPLTYWCESKTNLRISIPTHLLSMQGCFSYSRGWHPFVATLQDGPEILAKFYDRFVPTNITEMYLIEPSGELGETLPPWEIPWILRGNRTPPPGEHGLGIEHGISFYGPASEEKVVLEHQRLRTTVESIKKNGYNPDRFGDITGYFLLRGDEYRFFVRGGKHRAAALAFLGYENIPVQMKPFWPRMIDLSTDHDWPLVCENKISQILAARIFNSYFDNNGSRVQELLTS